MISYFVTLLYAVVMFQLFGRDWLITQKDLFNEFIIITTWIYTMGLFGSILFKLKNKLHN